MAMTYATITGQITRPGSNVGIRAKITATPLTTNAALKFVGDDRMTVGPETAETSSSGTLSTLQVPTNVDLAELYWRITAEALDKVPGVPAKWTIKNAVQITGTGTVKLKDLVEIDVTAVNAQVIGNLTDLVGDAEAAATTATAKATETEGWAEAATSSAADADLAADTATGAASSASTSAGTASTAASTATGAASTATGAASTATTKAGEASSSATAASESATAAQTAKTAAETARTDAEAARDQTVEISGINDVEGAMDSLLPAKISDSADPVGSALSDSIEDTGTVVANTARGMSMEVYEQQTARDLRVLWQDGATLYGGTDAGAVMKSTDRGVTWTATGGSVATIDGIYKLSTGTLLAWSNTSKKLYRSTDDGATFAEIKALTDRILGSQGVIECPDGSILQGDYGTTAVTSYQIWRSTDDGATWTTVFTPPATPSATQIHSIVWDPIEGCHVAFVDGAPPRHYRSDDNGVTWTLIGTATDREHPNWVAPMFFDTHIAWGYDSEYGGKIARLSREDYYAGNWTGNVEQITAVNGKAWYWTFPVRPGVWAVSLTDEVVSSGVYTNPREIGSYAQEVYVVHDNGRQVSGGVSWSDPDAVVGTLTHNKIRFPAYPPDGGPMDGTIWLSVLSKDGSSYASVPATAGWGDPLRRIDPALVRRPILRNNEWQYITNAVGSLGGWVMLNSSDRLTIRHPFAVGSPEMRWEAGGNGQITFVYGGVEVARFQAGRFRIASATIFEFGTNGPRVTTFAGSPEAVVSSPAGTIGLQTDGDAANGAVWIKESGTGTTGWRRLNGDPVRTSAQLLQDTDRINTTGKYRGKQVYDTDLGKPLWAAGAGATDTWNDATGAVVHTPV